MFVEVGRDDGVFFGTPFLSRNQGWFVGIYIKLAVSTILTAEKGRFHGCADSMPH